MASHNDPQNRQGGGALPPPSFTPSSGRPGRPQRTRAIEVGSPETGPQQARAPRPSDEPPTVTDSQKIVKIRRGNTGETPAAVSPPPSISHSRAVFPDRSASPVEPAGPQGTSILPQSFSPKNSREMPAQSVTGTPRRVSGTPLQASSSPDATPAYAPRGNNSNQSAALGIDPGHARGAARSTGGSRPGGAGSQRAAPSPQAKKKRKKRIFTTVALVLLAALIAWPFGLLMWANSKLNHIDALSGASNTGGTTYLIAGSDSRGEDSDSHIKGARADTIMLLHVPESGPNALISLPRDIYVPIPGHNSNKINAAFSFGGAPLLVETVENLTNLTVDHYVEIGFSGVEGIVDAVGGVELCLDYSVKDKESKLDWTEGCHEADGETALAFARMRKKDPLGDIGRAERQRQVVSAVAKKLQSPGDLINPNTQRKLVDAGTGALVVSEGTGFVDLGKMALAFRKANSDGGVTGTPPILSLNYRPGGVGSAVQLDEAGTEQFFKDIAAGNLEPGEYNSLHN